MNKPFSTATTYKQIAHNAAVTYAAVARDVKTAMYEMSVARMRNRAIGGADALDTLTDAIREVVRIGALERTAGMRLAACRWYELCRDERYFAGATLAMRYLEGRASAADVAELEACIADVIVPMIRYKHDLDHITMRELPKG